MSDLISRQDALMEARPEYLNPSQQGHESYNQGWNGAISAYYTGIKMLPPYDTVIDCSGFIKWILDEIMDEENWEYNAVANGEIIARKLKKLGLLEVKDGYYIRHIKNNTKESDLVYRPSAEAIQGEWVFDTVIPIGGGAYSAGYRCSNCGASYFKVEDMSFCPNCGARMEGEEE